MKNLHNELSKYKDPQDADYTIHLKKIIFNDKFSKIPDDYFAIINDTKKNKQVRFSAFYCLFTEYRRFEQRYQLFTLVDNYITIFNEEIYEYLRDIIWSQYYKFKFLDTLRKDFYLKGIRYGKKAINEYNTKSNNIGCFNNFADIVLDSLLFKNIVSDTDVSDALQYVERAIYIHEEERNRAPYSRYYCSKAKLLAYQENYAEAREMIALAISYERTDEKDSLIRISSYHNTQLEINTAETLQLVDSKVTDERYEKIQTQLEQQQIKYIEILGFFATIISLIIGTISITLNIDTFGISSGLIIILTACLIISYTVLNILFSSHIGIFRIIITCLFTGSLLLLGYLIGNGFDLNLWNHMFCK